MKPNKGIMMNIKTFLDEFESWEGDDRKKMNPMLNMLSPLSEGELRAFQDRWDSSHPYDEFVKAQNKKIRQCIELELGALGTQIRTTIGLDPLTLETEIARTIS